MSDDLIDHKTFRLINLVKARKALYDNTSNEHLNKITKKKAWREIAEELGDNVAACKEKWKSMRACYTRHLRRRAINPHRTSYYLADHLGFVLPFLKNLTKYTYDIPTSSTSTLETTNSDIKTVQKFNSDEFEEDSRDASDNDNNDTQTEHIYISPSSNSILENDSSVNQEKETEEHANEYIHSNNSKQESLKRKLYSSMEQPEEIRKKSCLCNEDPDLTFFGSILPDLHRMNNKQKMRLKLKILKEINSILYSNDTDSD